MNIMKGIVVTCCARLPSGGTDVVQIARQFLSIPYYGGFLSALDTGN